MTSSETRLHSGKGMVGFEMVGDLFLTWLSKTLEREGRIDIQLKLEVYIHLGWSH